MINVEIIKNRKIAVQHECIPQAILCMDIICQAKSGMRKTAVFILETMQQIAPVDGTGLIIVLAIEKWAIVKNLGP